MQYTTPLSNYVRVSFFIYLWASFLTHTKWLPKNLAHIKVGKCTKRWKVRKWRNPKRNQVKRNTKCHFS